MNAVSRGLGPASSALLILLIVSAAAGSISGCTRRSQSEQPSTDHRIELEVKPNPPSVGQARLLISLYGPDGEPIEGAHISARGDMNHAGMVPVFGEAQEIERGRYQIPFEWTMAGDWIVTVEAELPDGQRLEHRLDLRVQSEEG